MVVTGLVFIGWFLCRCCRRPRCRRLLLRARARRYRHPARRYRCPLPSRHRCPPQAATQAPTARLGPSPDTAACDLGAVATIASAGATVTAAVATSLAAVAISPDPVEAPPLAGALASAAITFDALSFARALTAADAAAALALHALVFQGAHREAWAAAHKPL